MENIIRGDSFREMEGAPKNAKIDFKVKIIVNDKIIHQKK